MIREDMIVEIAAYCAEEVKRQGRGPIQVGWMIEAWIDAIQNPVINQTNILQWGWLIERTVNQQTNWRGINVYVGNHMPPRPDELERLMAQFVANIDGMTPEEAYKEFEFIHPFRDGNGRTGKIIYNLKMDKMLDPVWPPNFWGISNP